MGDPGAAARWPAGSGLRGVGGEVADAVAAAAWAGGHPAGHRRASGGVGCGVAGGALVAPVLQRAAFAQEPVTRPPRATAAESGAPPKRGPRGPAVATLQSQL